MPNRKSANIFLLGLLAIAISPLGITAQNHGPHKQPRYRLVDLGTLGGPHSFLSGSIESLNLSGAVTGCADTSFLDPDFAIQNPYFSDPYIERSYLKSSQPRSSWTQIQAKK